MPEGFRDTLAAAGIYGMRVLWFERGRKRFTPPRSWSADAAAMTSTHDLPTVAGWWRGEDIDTRAALGLADAGTEREGRKRDRARFGTRSAAPRSRQGRSLRRTHTADVVEAALRFTAKTSSELALLPLEDILGLEEQPNLPGTIERASELAASLSRLGRHIVKNGCGSTQARAAQAARPLMTPRATMRLQFHKGFTFADAAGLVPYFSALGISHLYASPIMTARPGSLHGYDVIDPTRVNPELGGEVEFRRLVAELRRHAMGIVIDIVPNHMATGAGNPWWMDVLAGGRTSRYAKYFDIDWKPVDLHLRGKVLLPVLGRQYGEALAAGEIKLEAENGKAFVRYFDRTFPLADVAAHAVAQANPDAFDPATQQGRERLHEILEDQYYRLAWWRLANDEINWRRFFDINDLVALRIEVDEVFDAVHATVFRLYAQGLIDGVRVDHIDGLAQPGPYCRKLRARLDSLEPERPADAPKGPAYFVVEKILSRDEALRPQWETDGTTGYDFMDEVDALQHDAAGEEPLTRAWQRISGRSGNFDDEEELARRQILDRSFSAQRESSVLALYAILQSELDAARHFLVGAAPRLDGNPGALSGVPHLLSHRSVIA